MTNRVVDPRSVSGKTPAPERHVPLIVVGGGPAGVAAATAAARAGVRVLLLDEHPLDPELMAMDVPLYFGQRMSAAVRDRGVMLERVVRANPALEEAIEAGVEVELGVSVWGAFRPGPTMRELGACVGVADQARSWLVGYDRLIVAAGARDLELAFRGWEKAGTMGAAGALALLTRYQAFAARRMVVLGSGPLGLAVATLARARGIEVPAVVEVSPALRGDAGAWGRIEREGVRFYPGHVVAEALGSRDEIEGVRLAALDGDLRIVPGREIDIACDTVCLAIGLVPQVELLQILGCRLVFRSERGGIRPRARRRAAHQLARRLCARRRRGRRRSARDVARPGRGGGPPRGTRRRGIARDHRRPSAPRQLLRETEVPARAAGPRAHDYWRQWLRATLATGGSDVLACQCEEVTRGELVGVQPPRYLGCPAPMRARRDSAPSPGRAARPGPGQAPDARRHGPLPGPALPRAGGAAPRGGGRRAGRHHPARELPPARPAASAVRPVAPRGAGVDARALGTGSASRRSSRRTGRAIPT